MRSISTPLEQRVPSPSDGWHACSRRCQLALDLTIRGTCYITTPLHSLGDSNEVGVLLNSLFLPLLLSRKYFNFESDIATLSFAFADRRATARTTTFVEPCSFQKKKSRASMLTSSLLTRECLSLSFLRRHSLWCVHTESGCCLGQRPQQSNHGKSPAAGPWEWING